MSLQKHVVDFLDQYRLAGSPRPPFTQSSKIVVAVSGGPDSLALLHLLAAVHPKTNLVAAHLNHGWRDTAVAEADFVAQTAAAWGLACFVEQVDTVALARERGLSLEEAGRLARYRFLAQVARRVGTSFMATGHNADDQSETVLMHLLRGSGLAGLRGMLPVSPVPESEGEMVIIRPLLTATRTEIEAYCWEHNLLPVTDPSNLDPAFGRNRLRHELLPVLAGYNPQIKARLQHLAAVAAADYDLLEALGRQAWADLLPERGEGWLRWQRTGWQDLPLSLRRYTLRQAVAQLRPWLRDVGFATLEQARQVAEAGQVGAQSVLPGGVTLLVDYESLALKAVGAPPIDRPQLPQLPEAKAIPLAVPGRVVLANGWELATTWLDNVEWVTIEANRDPWLAFVTAAAGDNLMVRSRLPGERFQPLGMAGRAATFKEVMINRKIPARLRPLWPIVATPDHPVWLVGHQLDERARVTAVGEQVFQIHCRRR